jgi:predicted RNase H-like HicB family nuclease
MVSVRLRPGLHPTRSSLDVTSEQDEDGMWVVACPAMPGCVSQGRTRDEALVNIELAITDCLEVRAELGMPLTIDD